MRSFSIDEWLPVARFSRSFFYKLTSQGEGPKTFKIGRCLRISEAAALNGSPRAKRSRPESKRPLQRRLQGRPEWVFGTLEEALNITLRC